MAEKHGTVVVVPGCWSELSRRPCFRSGAAATSPVICCFGELLVRGCIDTDYMLRILNHVVNHYMLPFYALRVAGFEYKV